MSTVTLEQIRDRQAELAALIEQLASAAASVSVLHLPEAHIQLHAGARYAGLVIAEDGTSSHHLILLPGEAVDVAWQAAIDWATAQGGELPTRQEQALLYANLKREFQPNWYWSAQEHENDGSYAWYQLFGYGGQDNTHKSYVGRARAVRRFPA